jgi:Protein of unknown function (DUF664)
MPSTPIARLSAVPTATLSVPLSHLAVAPDRQHRAGNQGSGGSDAGETSSTVCAGCCIPRLLLPAAPSATAASTPFSPQRLTGIVQSVIREQPRGEHADADDTTKVLRVGTEIVPLTDGSLRTAEDGTKISVTAELRLRDGGEGDAPLELVDAASLLAGSCEDPGTPRVSQRKAPPLRTDVSSELLTEAFGRIPEVVHSALEDASIDVLTFRADPEANTIAWLVWHLTRIQDDHIAALTGDEQVWTAGGWFDRFDLPFDPEATGYGHSAGEVAAVRADAGLLAGYYGEVHTRTLDYLPTLREADFARIVDTSWNPPVTLAVRLISILSDDLQHAGQAAYLRGLAERAGLSPRSTTKGPRHAVSQRSGPGESGACGWGP